jgi:hypothetical protein
MMVEERGEEEKEGNKGSNRSRRLLSEVSGGMM